MQIIKKETIHDNTRYRIQSDTIPKEVLQRMWELWNITDESFDYPKMSDFDRFYIETDTNCYQIEVESKHFKGPMYTVFAYGSYPYFEMEFCSLIEEQRDLYPDFSDYSNQENYNVSYDQFVGFYNAKNNLEKAVAFEYKGMLFDDWVVSEIDKTVYGIIYQEQESSFAKNLMNWINQDPNNNMSSLKRLGEVCGDQSNEYVCAVDGNRLRPITKEDIPYLKAYRDYAVSVPFVLTAVEKCLKQKESITASRIQSELKNLCPDLMREQDSLNEFKFHNISFNLKDIEWCVKHNTSEDVLLTFNNSNNQPIVVSVDNLINQYPYVPNLSYSDIDFIFNIDSPKEFEEILDDLVK